MSTSAAKAVLIDQDPTAIEVVFSETALQLVLSDGYERSAPLAWFSRLRDATVQERGNWRLIGTGHGLHWPDIDEDISVRALLGRPS
jgi:hypothetical protein